MDLQIGRVARDGEKFRSGDTVFSWYPASGRQPDGVSNSSSGICVTEGGEVVLVSEDGFTWDIPGGRPEGREDWKQTLEREVLEEACAEVEDSMLLGYARSGMASGKEEEETLVRVVALAVVSLNRWEPRHEIVQRCVVPFGEALTRISFDNAPEPIYRRAFYEASAAMASRVG